jgi:hypothetical protein
LKSGFELACCLLIRKDKDGIIRVADEFAFASPVLVEPLVKNVVQVDIGEYGLTGAP